jgi:hypothetical protein
MIHTWSFRETDDRPADDDEGVGAASLSAVLLVAMGGCVGFSPTLSADRDDEVVSVTCSVDDSEVLPSPASVAATMGVTLSSFFFSCSSSSSAELNGLSHCHAK